jgi:valyl-tRNA synthetase
VEVDVKKITAKMVYANINYKSQHYKEDLDKVMQRSRYSLDPYIMTLEFSKLDEHKLLLKDWILNNLNNRIKDTKETLKQYRDMKSIFEVS